MASIATCSYKHFRDLTHLTTSGSVNFQVLLMSNTELARFLLRYRKYVSTEIYVNLEADMVVTKS